MAQLYNNFQNFGYGIPADGEVFVNKNDDYWKTSIYKRVGNNIIQFNTEEFAVREDPKQANNRNRGGFGRELLKSKYGIDYAKLKGYTGEGIGYFTRSGGTQKNITDISQFKDTSTEFTRSETITQGLDPKNSNRLLTVSSLSGKTPPPPAPAGALAGLTAQTPGGQAAAKAAGQPISTPASTPTPPTPTPTQPKPASISDPSIVNFLDAQGKPSDFTSRTQLAGQQGITNYTGTAEQNTQLLDSLRKTVTPAIGSPEATKSVLAESTRVASEAAQAIGQTFKSGAVETPTGQIQPTQAGLDELSKVTPAPVGSAQATQDVITSSTQVGTEAAKVAGLPEFKPGAVVTPTGVQVTPEGSKALGDVLQKQQTSLGSPSKMPSVVDTPAPSTGTTPELPIPQTGNIQDAFGVSLQSKVDTARTTLENTYKTQLEDLQKRIDESNQSMDELTSLQGEGVEDVENLMQPFREKLENAERERLYINENFEANQALTNELEGLLTEGNELIRQQKEITGLSAIRNPRIDKTISDVNSRAGVIQAVMSARNGQISQAYTMIDRSVNAINADKQDQLTYYSTLFTFYESQKDAEGNKLTTLTNEKKSFLGAQIGLLENDMAQAQNNANYIKDLMTDPDTALYMARAGVSLNDSPETVNQKMAQESQRQEVENFKTEKLDEGYTFVPYGNGNTTFSVGGKELSFNAPPEKAGDTPVTTVDITPEDRRNLIGAGFTVEESNQISNDVNQFGIDAVLEGVDNEQQKNAIEKVYGVEKVEEQFLNIDYFTTNFTEDQLKESAKAGGFRKFFSSWETEKENYLNSVMQSIELYRNSGFSDTEILKKMQ